MLIVIAIATGLFATAQSGFNSLLIDRWGLLYVIGANAAISLLLVGCLFALQFVLPRGTSLSEFMQAPESWQLPWWAILPGIFGGLVMMGFAFSFGQLGAAPTTLIVIATQILASFSWDYFEKGDFPSLVSILGALVCAFGALVALVWGRA